MPSSCGLPSSATSVILENYTRGISFIIAADIRYQIWSLRCSCKCVCKREDSEEAQTEIPQPAENPVDVPPDIVVSVIRSSSGIFSGTLSAVSTMSGMVSSGLSRLVHDERYAGDPPPYEEPPSYKVATEQHCASVCRSDTV